MVITTKDLWIEFARDRNNEQLREKVILQYTPLVRYVMDRLAISYPGIMDSDDIFNCGILGLIQSVDRFDPSLGVKFETYAISRIKGAIIDELRKLDPVARSTRKMAKQIEQAHIVLQESLGRPATEVEIADHLGIDVDTLNNITKELSWTTISLDSSYDSEDAAESVTIAEQIEDRSSPNPLESLERKELAETLAQILAQIPYREKLVLSLYYTEELTLKEISKVLGVSESRVSQLHTQAMLRIRAYLKLSAKRRSQS